MRRLSGCHAGFETCSHASLLKQSGYRADGTSLSFRRGRAHLRLVFQQSSFASLTIATARNTIRVPDDVPLDILDLPVRGHGRWRGDARVKPQPGDSYVAFGTGTVGCAGLLAAKLAGCDPIIAVDVFDDRLALARSLGRRTPSTPQTRSWSTRSDASRAGVGPSGALKRRASPRPSVPRSRYCAARHRVPRRQRALGSRCPGDADPATRPQRARVHQGESDVQTFLPHLIALYRAGQLPIERLVRHYPHAAINDAVADMLAGTTIKAVLQIGTA